MKMWLVWDRANGSENGSVYRAWTHKGALRKHRKVLGFLGAMSWADVSP